MANNPPTPRGDTDWHGAAMEIRRAATSRGRSALGCFSLEGTRLHERALAAGAQIELAVVSQSFRAAPTERTRRLMAGLQDSGCRLYTAADDELRDLIDGRSAGAIVGLARLPKAPSFDDIFTPPSTRRTVLVAVDVLDPGNVGALVRTCLAFDVAAFIGVGVSDAYHPKAVRTSMGSVFKLPVLQLGDPQSLFDELRKRNVLMLAAVSSGGAAVSELDCGAAARALFVGSEAFGLNEGLVAELDTRVTVPMAAGVDSLSLNAAAAVILHELQRPSIGTASTGSEEKQR